MTIEQDVQALKSDMKLLEPEKPRYGRSDFDRDMIAMRSSQHGLNLMLSGTFVFDDGGAARSDVGARFEVNVYASGSTIVIQCFDKDAGAWRSVTLT
jgi:hypothetical protein|tara:strand:- start:799 stop:1089 length:291 start_codon:yes stop_codon:yes gene_type:complete